MPDAFDFEGFLQSTMNDFGCQTGTIHRTAADGRTLELVVHAGIPEPLVERISRIPFGKGIAGVAAATREPVELCNLQQDLGGVAKADARSTGVAGSLAVPVCSPEGSVVGTLGIGKHIPHEFTASEKASLAARAVELAAELLAAG
jgi:L-methionine (R)-S-oxide reductase